jgi:hypothetical protein
MAERAAFVRHWASGFASATKTESHLSPAPSFSSPLVGRSSGLLASLGLRATQAESLPIEVLQRYGWADKLIRFGSTLCVNKRADAVALPHCFTGPESKGA